MRSYWERRRELEERKVKNDCSKGISEEFEEYVEEEEDKNARNSRVTKASNGD